MNFVIEIGTSLRLASEASDSLRNRQSEVRLMLRWRGSKPAALA